MARRFNVGDRVVKFNPTYYNNIFHREKYVEYAQVTDANDDRFTTSGKLTNFDNGTNYNECFQSSGKLVYGYMGDATCWFNLDTEQELINEFHAKAEVQFVKEVKEKNDEEIARIKAQIKSLEKSIERLESMEDAYMGYTTLKTFEHIGDMSNILKTKIERCKKIYKK